MILISIIISSVLDIKKKESLEFCSPAAAPLKIDIKQRPLETLCENSATGAFSLVQVISGIVLAQRIACLSDKPMSIMSPNGLFGA